MSKFNPKFTREELAIQLCDDLLKKLSSLERMSDEAAKLTVEGVVDGLGGNTIAHPYEGIPDVLKSMQPHYCGGFEVGSTWGKIAREWQKAGA